MNVLSLRGGGMRAVATAHFLDMLEQVEGKPIHSFVDLIAGTSAGAIVGAGLAIGMPAADIVRFFEQEGASIFERKPWFHLRRMLFMPRYELQNLTEALNKHFLPETKFADTFTKLMILATRFEGQEAQFWKSWKHPQMSIVEAVSASAAAPWYFAPVKSGEWHYCDGGPWGNNPSIWAAIQARKLWPLRSPMNVVDICCPYREVMVAPKGAGIFSIAPIIVGLCIQSGENASSNGTEALCDRYTRVRPPILGASEDIGDARQSNIEALKRSADYNSQVHIRDVRKTFRLIP